MKRPPHIAIIFIAACALSTGAIGQKVYRCGSTYGQTPCANAVAVDVEDSRSHVQKSESDALIQREASAANAMEKARLQEEARDRLDRPPQPATNGKKTSPKPRSSKSTSSPGDTDATAASGKKSHAHKKKDPEFFTARATTEKPKAKAKTDTAK